MMRTPMTVLFVFFLRVALCFLRASHADRWHIVLCFVAAALWGSLLLFVPGTRTLMFGLAALSFLIVGLS
jgi:hypothetical protein